MKIYLFFFAIASYGMIESKLEKATLEQFRTELNHDRDVFRRYHDGLENSRFIREVYETLLKELYPIRLLLKPIYEHFNTPTQHPAPWVRMSPKNELCAEEQQFLQNREAVLARGFKQFLGSDVNNKKPTIGICCSGGGFRSMILTLGLLSGAQQCGLLDCVTYLSGLSGSTWAIAPWIASQRDLESHKKGLAQKITGGLDHINEPGRLKDTANKIIEKIIYGQVVSAVDIYGPLLANTLLYDLGDKRMKATLSETHAHVINGSYPLPIYTAINVTPSPYDWFEFTPFEIGSMNMQMYVPTWSFGRYFKNGIARDDAPEQSLGYLMGIFGSAFEVNLKDMVRLTVLNFDTIKSVVPDPVYGQLKKYFNYILGTAIGSTRVLPSMLPNFTYGIESNPLKLHRSVALVDAGIDFNLPVPPLLKPSRHVDMLIILDASSGIEGCRELRHAEIYARDHGLKFPSIDYDQAATNVLSVFKDPHDPACPVVVYVPRIKNPSYPFDFDPDTCTASGPCGTFNFAYTVEEFNLLHGLMEHTIKQHAETFKNEIREIISKNKPAEHLHDEL